MANYVKNYFCLSRKLCKIHAGRPSSAIFRQKILEVFTENFFRIRDRIACRQEERAHFFLLLKILYVRREVVRAEKIRAETNSPDPEFLHGVIGMAENILRTRPSLT